MTPDNLPKPENQQYDPNLEAQDEEVVSGGNNRILYAVVGLVLALVLGYVLMPKGNGSSSGVSSVMPSFMLDDAAVTATAPTSADSIAAGLKAAPAPTAVEAESKDPKASVKTAASAVRPTPLAAAAPVATTAAVASVPASASAPDPTPTAAPEPAAPASVTMTGKIEDENGRPLVGATVLLKGSNKGTSTDANGNYTLEVPGGNDNVLVYGYGGYDDEIVRSRTSQLLNVTLTPRAKVSKRRR